MSHYNRGDLFLIKKTVQIGVQVISNSQDSTQKFFLEKGMIISVQEGIGLANEILTKENDKILKFEKNQSYGFNLVFTPEIKKNTKLLFVLDEWTLNKIATPIELKDFDFRMEMINLSYATRKRKMMSAKRAEFEKELHAGLKDALGEKEQSFFEHLLNNRSNDIDKLEIDAIENSAAIKFSSDSSKYSHKVGDCFKLKNLPKINGFELKEDEMFILRCIGVGDNKPYGFVSSENSNCYFDKILWVDSDLTAADPDYPDYKYEFEKIDDTLLNIEYKIGDKFKVRDNFRTYNKNEIFEIVAIEKRENGFLHPYIMRSTSGVLSVFTHDLTISSNFIPYMNFSYGRIFQLEPINEETAKEMQQNLTYKKDFVEEFSTRNRDLKQAIKNVKDFFNNFESEENKYKVGDTFVVKQSHSENFLPVGAELEIVHVFNQDTTYPYRMKTSTGSSYLFTSDLKLSPTHPDRENILLAPLKILKNN